jgi:prepilin-type N-terminal cleavage/methylation domain-containing protein
MERLLKGVHSKDTGFTLIELLIVIAVLAILSSIAVPVYLGQRTKAMTQEAKSNLEIIRLLQEQYSAEHGEYAPRNESSDGTLSNVAQIRVHLPGFKPGLTGDLKFDYSMDYVVNSVTASFTAKATGKAGTPVENVKWSLNSDNEWGAF